MARTSRQRILGIFLLPNRSARSRIGLERHPSIDSCWNQMKADLDQAQAENKRVRYELRRLECGIQIHSGLSTTKILWHF